MNKLYLYLKQLLNVEIKPVPMKKEPTNKFRYIFLPCTSWGSHPFRANSQFNGKRKTTRIQLPGSFCCKQTNNDWAENKFYVDLRIPATTRLQHTEIKQKKGEFYSSRQTNVCSGFNA